VDCRRGGRREEGMDLGRDLEITYAIGRRKRIQINKIVVVARAVGGLPEISRKSSRQRKREETTRKNS